MRFVKCVLFANINIKCGVHNYLFILHIPANISNFYFNAVFFVARREDIPSITISV